MWELSAADTAALLDVIAALPPTSPLDLPMPLGYRGFLVSLTAPESGTEMVIHAFQGDPLGNVVTDSFRNDRLLAMAARKTIAAAT